jgi:hypothetical protein
LEERAHVAQPLVLTELDQAALGGRGVCPMFCVRSG